MSPPFYNLAAHSFQTNTSSYQDRRQQLSSLSTTPISMVPAYAAVTATDHSSSELLKDDQLIDKKKNINNAFTSTPSSVPRSKMTVAPPREIVVPGRRETSTGAAAATTSCFFTPPEDNFRAVHRIQLSALQHNFTVVEGAANRQRCSVITVVKADGYGHGAIAAALYLADVCGADAFAVATLEEGVALRKAFQNNPPGKWSKELASQFHTQTTNSTVVPNHHHHHHSQLASSASVTVSGNSSADSPVTCEFTARVMRPSRIRILVLGPPVGFPRCFDDYHYHDIELMVSGPEVAEALVEWVVNEKERKRTQVERSASDAKIRALTGQHNLPKQEEPQKAGQLSHIPASSFQPKIKVPCSTLSNVQGQDLAKELRAILLNQSKVALENAAAASSQASFPRPTPLASAQCSSSESSVTSDKQYGLPPPPPPSPPTATPFPATGKPPVAAPPRQPTVAFGGIEAVAKSSRQREIASTVSSSSNSSPVITRADAKVPSAGLNAPVASASALPARKMLRWHALVDSGMGRLGFRTEPVSPGDGEDGERQDSVEILKELVDMEIHGKAPIEFFGMCTHMAEANATSTYTHQQISKFVSLLKRVRDAGIFVPTLSTDNSMALLTSELNHFDPKEILSQSDADTRGYVRTGGAIFGQRPTFRQLKAVSTLLASVRHVAILRKGESVGYDRAYVAEYDVRIATLTIGFADGYPRELGNRKGRVAIRGSVFPVVGNVCMDMVMVELGRADDKTTVGATVSVRDIAVMWGPLDEEDGEGLVKLQDIAAELKTTQSALTCGLDKIRVRRQFI